MKHTAFSTRKFPTCIATWGGAAVGHHTAVTPNLPHQIHSIL
jgi:hypothetical protein